MPISDWAPTVEAVGAQLRARTLDGNGNELGTFTDQTRPTESQAQELIDKAAKEVASKIGTDPGEAYWDGASGVAALRAAMKIELSYFPEQINTGRSPYNQLRDEYREAFKELLATMPTGTGEQASQDADLVFSFPDDTDFTPTSWATNW